MPIETQPGTDVRITVTKRPTNAAAVKTLTRIFGKDADRRKVKQRQKAMLQRAVRTRQRGGRQWSIRPRIPNRTPATGDSCTIRATLDVILDLGSVERFVSVQPAG